jgi:lipoate---protein ligase
MKYIDHTLATPAENLACDEALLDLCEAGGEGELLRFWEPTGHFVVLGYANRASVEADLAACEARKIGVFRRCSGGGTVLQGPGCLNYSVILQILDSGPLQSITAANRFILERHKTALQPLVADPIEIRGQTDLVIVSQGKGENDSLARLKFSGNAQRRKRRFLIFHGTFLLQFDITLIEAVLRMPSKHPEYRESRSHARFLANLGIPAARLKDALRSAWGADDARQGVPAGEVSRLVATKYGTADWNLRF